MNESHLPEPWDEAYTMGYKQALKDAQNDLERIKTWEAGMETADAVAILAALEKRTKHDYHLQDLDGER